LDEKVAGILGLPDLAPLRELLAREPIICLTADRLMPQKAPAATLFDKDLP
jgi:hypothetical protein